MSTFDDRETAFEAKFAHDGELRFRAEARANKLLGQWAAGLMGKAGAEADGFALQVVKADMAEPGPEDVIRFVVAALAGRADAAAVRRKHAECLAEARAQIVAER